MLFSIAIKPQNKDVGLVGGYASGRKELSPFTHNYFGSA
jgi:hypothetical protein